MPIWLTVTLVIVIVGVCTLPAWWPEKHNDNKNNKEDDNNDV